MANTRTDVVEKRRTGECPFGKIANGVRSLKAAFAGEAK